jgi:hypothetical protein
VDSPVLASTAMPSSAIWRNSARTPSHRRSPTVVGPARARGRGPHARPPRYPTPGGAGMPAERRPCAPAPARPASEHSPRRCRVRAVRPSRDRAQTASRLRGAIFGSSRSRLRAAARGAWPGRARRSERPRRRGTRSLPRCAAASSDRSRASPTRPSAHRHRCTDPDCAAPSARDRRRGSAFQRQRARAGSSPCVCEREQLAARVLHPGEFRPECEPALLVVQAGGQLGGALRNGVRVAV